jgi:hypothetical protein
MGLSVEEGIEMNVTHYHALYQVLGRQATAFTFRNHLVKIIGFHVRWF